MITTRELEELGFVLDDKYGDKEQYVYELDNCVLSVLFEEYGKKFKILMYQNGYVGDIELLGDINTERIKKILHAFQ